jgi:hypothetical protein
MSGSTPVHFEVFRRRSPRAEWELLGAFGDRETALEEARTAHARNPTLCVRVTKETRDGADGSFSSLMIKNWGPADPELPVRNRVEVDAPPCMGPDDLFSPHARRTIARVLENWLRRMRVTPWELVHRIDLFDLLEASAGDFQGALQKVAAATSTNGGDVHATLRHLLKLVSMAAEKLRKESRDLGRPEDAVKVALRQRTRLGTAVALANGFSALRGHAPRIAVAAGWLAQLPPEGPEAARVRSEIDAWLAETIMVAGTEDLVPDAPPTGIVNHLAALLDPAAAAGSPLPLAPLFADASMVQMRRALATRVLAEMRTMARQSPDCLVREFAALDRLATTLRAARIDDRPLENVDEAISQRAQRLLSDDCIAELSRLHAPLGRAVRLAAIAVVVDGPGPIHRITGLLHGTLATPAFERDVMDRTQPVLERLRALGQVSDSVAASAIAERERERILARVEERGLLVLSSENVVEAVLAREGRLLAKATALLRLAAERALPPGRCAAMALTAAESLMRHPEVRDDLGAQPQLRPVLLGLLEGAKARAA